MSVIGQQKLATFSLTSAFKITLHPLEHRCGTYIVGKVLQHAFDVTTREQHLIVCKNLLQGGFG
jgi:hypothetical protein